MAAIGFGINEADTCVKFARAGDFDLAMKVSRYSLLIQNGLTEFTQWPATGGWQWTWEATGACSVGELLLTAGLSRLSAS